MIRNSAVTHWVLLLAFLASQVCHGFRMDTAKTQSLLRSNLQLFNSKTDTSVKAKKLKWDFGKIAFSLLPLSPESVGRRKTILTEVVKGSVYTLDQVQGIINVNVPVRCTIIKLSGGGLFVNNPVAPTEECIEMVRDLEKKHGDVKYITLSSLALEHKGTAGAFSSYFPSSSVFVQPGQYSFPVDLPTQLFFPFGKQVDLIPEDSEDAPWFADIDHKSLGPLRPPGVGGFAETAFFHRDSGTVLVTDTVIQVPDAAPAIIDEDPRALLYHSRDDQLQVVSDTLDNRKKGWRRMVLFGLCFQPSGIDVKPTLDAVKDLKSMSPEMKKLGEGAIPYDGGLYPWEWVQSEEASFAGLQLNPLVVAPILQKLILNREPNKVIAWVDAVCQWQFKRVIPCHFANDVKASPSDFRQAFDFLYEPSGRESSSQSAFPLGALQGLFGGQKASSKRKSEVSAKAARQALSKDTAFLGEISQQLTTSRVLYPEAPLLKRG